LYGLVEKISANGRVDLVLLAWKLLFVSGEFSMLSLEINLRVQGISQALYLLPVLHFFLLFSVIPHLHHCLVGMVHTEKV